MIFYIICIQINILNELQIKCEQNVSKRGAKLRLYAPFIMG